MFQEQTKFLKNHNTLLNIIFPRQEKSMNRKNVFANNTTTEASRKIGQKHLIVYAPQKPYHIIR